MRTVWGKPLDAIATALRGCLIPAPGKVFVVRDLSQIEARVIAWLAGQDDLLKVFEDPANDVYVYTQRKRWACRPASGEGGELGLGVRHGPGAFRRLRAVLTA